MADSDLRSFLIIDDNPSDIRHLRAVLHMVLGYSVEIRDAASSLAALDAVASKTPDVVFADHLSPGETAFSTMEKLRRHGYSGPIVVVTGLSDPIKQRQLLAAGALEVVFKDDLDSRALAHTLSKVREHLKS